MFLQLIEFDKNRISYNIKKHNGTYSIRYIIYADTGCAVDT